MSVKTVTCSGGPLDTLTYDIPLNVESFKHHADPAGRYHVDDQVATWQDAATETDALPAEGPASVQTPASVDHPAVDGPPKPHPPRPAR